MKNKYTLKNKPDLNDLKTKLTIKRNCFDSEQDWRGFVFGVVNCDYVELTEGEKFNLKSLGYIFEDYKEDEENYIEPELSENDSKIIKEMSYLYECLSDEGKINWRSKYIAMG